MQTRRLFLKQAGLTAASLFIAEKILADPYHPLHFLSPAIDPIRIKGIVKSDGKGLANIVVTDGRSVVQTARDGTFAFPSTSAQEFVYVALPSGYGVPKNPTGTALFYQPIAPNKQGEVNATFDLAKLPTSDTKHAFFQLADPQTLDNNDVVRFQSETVPDISAMTKQLGDVPMFGVACGDIMFDRLEHYPGYEQGVKGTGIPFFQVLGNHDVEVQTKTDEASATTFRRHFGPTSYSFNRGEVHYVVLDNVFWFGGYIGYIDQTQLDWLKADLAFVEKGKTVVVFMHIPIYCEQHKRLGEKNPENSVVVTNRQLLYRLLEGYKAYILCGHTHESEYFSDGGAEIHVNGAVCGAWWTGDICHDGTPNGYSVYEVNGSELSWRYKSTGRPMDYQLKVYPKGADPQHPDEFFANIWGANSRWQINWYEDGIKKGAMERRLGKDPESVKLLEGPDLPKRHKWVDPLPTDHLFYAKPSPGAKEIIVEATDGAGRVYREKIQY